MARPAMNDTRLTVEEYLELEKSSPVKHEYEAGYLHAMSGASSAHNIICLNIASILRSHLRGTPCRTYIADVKTRIEAASRFYYPDVMVSCEGQGDRYYRDAPVLIVEVLSESTMNRDKGEKWRNYQTLSSLREYVLVSQDSMDVRVFRRDEAGEWRQSIYTDGAVIPLLSVELEIPIEQVYEEAWD
jgi:Uma2 family endonuclease